jgi:hypothetical protein
MVREEEETKVSKKVFKRLQKESKRKKRNSARKELIVPLNIHYAKTA